MREAAGYYSPGCPGVFYAWKTSLSCTLRRVCARPCYTPHSVWRQRRGGQCGDGAEHGCGLARSKGRAGRGMKERLVRRVKEARANPRSSACLGNRAWGAQAAEAEKKPEAPQGLRRG